MLVFLDKRFVPEDQAVVSVFDRSFLYGDGIFETILVSNGVPFRWREHMDRLEKGAEFLKIALPMSAAELRNAAALLLHENKMPEGLLRITLSRGVGIRGYSPRNAHSPSVVISTYPGATPGPARMQNWRLRISSFRLPANETLAQFKTCNKLPQVLARSEAELAGADEALLLNTDGLVVEGASSNLFWVKQKTVFTPPLTSGILSGVTRLVILELCRELGLATECADIRPAELLKTDAVFMTLSTLGVVQGVTLNDEVLPTSGLTGQLHARYFQAVELETKSE